MVIDAGGGTVDFSTYTFTNSTPIVIKEIAEPGCKFSIHICYNMQLRRSWPGIYQGSVLVGGRASAYFKGVSRSFICYANISNRRHLEKLASSPFGKDSYVEAITTEFNRTTKKRFKGTGTSSIKFGNVPDMDPSVGIRNGQMRLTASVYFHLRGALWELTERIFTPQKRDCLFL